MNLKLNKSGWGFTQMFIMSAILLILLLIVTYYIYVFYNRLDTKAGSQYFNLETKLQSAAILYSKKNNSSSGSVSLYTLKKEGYITDFTDINDNDCNGYVIYNDDKFDSYIKCEYFTSKNYNQKYE